MHTLSQVPWKVYSHFPIVTHWSALGIYCMTLQDFFFNATSQWIDQGNRLKHGDMPFTAPLWEGSRLRWLIKTTQTATISVCIHQQPQIAISKWPVTNHEKARGKHLLDIRLAGGIRGDQGGRCFVFLTNVKEHGNNIAHCTAGEVLCCAKQREIGYSLLHIIAERCTETETDDISYVFGKPYHPWNLSVPVGKITLALFGHVMGVKEQRLCMLFFISSAHINCF